MNVGIVNYGMGNLASVQKAVETLGHSAFVTDDPAHLTNCERIILPGVGAFAEGMDRLEAGGWPDAIRHAVKAGTPVLGICLGMQFLADRGDEGGERPGLGLVSGEIVSLRSMECGERVPHAGWNEARRARADPLFDGLPEVADYYFVHSYAFRPSRTENVLATTDYGCEITAVVRNRRVWGTQFHPEKSSKAGLRLLRNFIELGEC
ncbi:MAG: imidazole glycerol phosphate synthase subunit HisH [Sphingomicrobium sp.]